MAIASTVLNACVSTIALLVPEYEPARNFRRQVAFLDFQLLPATADNHRDFILVWDQGVNRDQSFEDCDSAIRFQKTLKLIVLYHAPNQEPTGDLQGVIEDDYDQICNAFKQIRILPAVYDSTGTLINIRVGEDRSTEPLANGNYLALTTSIEVLYERRF